MGNRIRIVEFVPGLLVEALRGHEMSRIESDWPADAEIIDAWVEHNTRSLKFVVQSSTFDEVPEGFVVPNWNPTYHSYETGTAFLLNLIQANLPDA